MRSSHALAAGHWREESYLARAGNGRLRLDVGMVDGGTDYQRFIERVGVTFALPRQPCDQIADGADVRGRIDRLLRFADPFAHPGEIFHLHASSSLMR